MAASSVALLERMLIEWLEAGEFWRTRLWLLLSLFQLTNKCLWIDAKCPAKRDELHDINSSVSTLTPAYE